jgi:hypothetical protein
VSKASKLNEKSLTYGICEDYAKGKTFADISNKRGRHKEQVKRETIKGLKWFLERYEDPEKHSEEKKKYTSIFGPYF